MRENNEGWSLIYDVFRNKEIKMDANFFAPNVPKTEIQEITKYTVVLDSTITTDFGTGPRFVARKQS